MGYFDGLTDAAFKTDTEGRTLFFPWGIFGNGFILDSEEKKKSIRTFIKRMYMIVLSAIILLQAIFGPWPNLILLPIYLAWYYFTVKKMTSGLSKGQEKLKISEAYSNSAKSHNLATLIFLEIVSIGFSFIGIALISSGNKALLGYATLTLFGLSALAIGYMICIKIKTKKAS